MSAPVERPLRARLLLALTLGVLLFGTLNIAFVTRLVYRAVAEEQERRLAFVAGLLTQRVVRPLLLDDRLSLNRLLEESRGIDPDLACVAVVGPAGDIVAAAPHERCGRWLSGVDSGGGQPGIRERRAPVLGGELGEVRVGMNEAALTAALERVVTTIAWMVVAFLAVGILASMLLSASVTRPLDRMIAFASAFPLEGEMPRLALGGRDEMAALGHHLVASAERVRALHQEAQERERHLARVENLAVLGTLAAGVAHEINNPLAGLRAAVDRLLRRLPDPGEAERYRTVLSEAIERIERTVRSVLSYARASEVELGSVDLRASLDRALELVGPRLGPTRVVRDLPPTRSRPCSAMPASSSRCSSTSS